MKYQNPYSIVSRDFIILEISGENLKRFAEDSSSLKVGEDIREPFPEFVGLEAKLIEIFDKSEKTFELSAISREVSPGKLIYFNLHITAYPDEQIPWVIIFFEEVTNYLTLKQKYLQSSNEANLLLNTTIAANAYIEQLIESIADSLFVTTVSGIIKKVNRSAEELFGYAKDELIGQPMSLIIANPQILQQVTGQNVSLGQNDNGDRQNGKNLEVSCQTKTGVNITVAFSCSMFSTEITELKNYIYVGRDITDRQRMEAELKQANENLTKSVHQLQERNREITLLSQLTYRLQGCMTLEEAYEEIVQMVSPIFPHSIGGIFMSDDPKQSLKMVTHWGDFPKYTLKNVSISDCAAWQTGTRYLTCNRRLCLFRQKFHPDSSEVNSCCVPMVVQGQSIGLLYLSGSELAPIEEKHQLAMTVAEHIGLALVNLKLQETLKNQSIRDPLTGLFNRRYLEESVEREIQQASQQQKSIGIIILDIDHFKRFNDTFGHLAGDAVLQAVGHLLNRSIRNLDLACRYGGEEFVVILRNSNLQIAQWRAEQLRLAVKLLRLEHARQSLGSISCSFGVACFPEHGQTLEALVAAADTALYQAKEFGRDRVVTAS